MKTFRYFSLCLVLLYLEGGRHSTWAAEATPWGNAPTTELLRLLDTLHQHYGPDTVTLVGSLLHAANHSGAVLTAAVRVNGPQEREGKTFLTFDVETGRIFNSKITDRAARLFALWRDILAKAFARLTTIQVPTDGIAIRLRYHHRPYDEGVDVAEPTDAPGESEEAAFYFPRESLQRFLDKTLSVQELLARTVVLVNDTPVPVPVALP
ncbi:MAG: hypothetical protein NZ578_14835 [Candidatus Binatia bacterium]|nr:hypothetical protein [Candidatus Binatia bacterium]